VVKSKIYLPLLDIKLGLIKISVEDPDTESEGFFMFKEKIYHDKVGQDERRDFFSSTN